MKYIIKFGKEPGSNAYSYFSSISVKDPQSSGGLWTVEMDGEQLVMLILKFPDAEIFRPLRRE